MNKTIILNFIKKYSNKFEKENDEKESDVINKDKSIEKYPSKTQENKIGTKNDDDFINLTLTDDEKKSKQNEVPKSPNPKVKKQELRKKIEECSNIKFVKNTMVNKKESSIVKMNSNYKPSCEISKNIFKK